LHHSISYGEINPPQAADDIFFQIWAESGQRFRLFTEQIPSPKSRRPNRPEPSPSTSSETAWLRSRTNQWPGGPHSDHKHHPVTIPSSRRTSISSSLTDPPKMQIAANPNRPGSFSSSAPIWLGQIAAAGTHLRGQQEIREAPAARSIHHVLPR
ncbi:hypothetical protein ACLOJK_006695, partial [Asimina triloba]